MLGEEASWPAVAHGGRVAALFDGLALPQLALETYCPLDAMPTAAVATRGLVNIAPPGAAKAAAPVAGGCIDMAASGGGAGLTRTITVPAATQAIRVRVGVTAGNRGLGSIDALVGGRNTGRVELPAGAGDVAALAAGQRVTVERVVPLPDLETNLVFRAYDGTGLASQSPPLLVKRDGTPPPQPVTLHVLAVGVDAYGGEWPPAELPAADARTFAEVIEANHPSRLRQGRGYPAREQDATSERVAAELMRCSSGHVPRDALLIYLAGHGTADAEGDYTYVTSNATSLADVASRA